MPGSTASLTIAASTSCADRSPPAADVFELARGPLQDPFETAQRREDLRRLVSDVGRLPEHQRSALLMREIDGLSYADIAGVLDVTVPSVKSLLVRARMGLVEAIEARDTACEVIREDLVSAYDRGVKSSARARRHLRECDGCREYRTALRGMKRSFAALTPAAGLGGPIALIASLSSGGKVAAVVCTAALATGTAVEVERKLTHPHKAAARVAAAPVRAEPAAPVDVSKRVVAPVTQAVRDRSAARSRPAPATHIESTAASAAPVTAIQQPRTAPVATAEPLAPTRDPSPTGASAAPPETVAEVEVDPAVAVPEPVVGEAETVAGTRGRASRRHAAPRLRSAARTLSVAPSADPDRHRRASCRPWQRPRSGQWHHHCTLPVLPRTTIHEPMTPAADGRNH